MIWKILKKQVITSIYVLSYIDTNNALLRVQDAPKTCFRCACLGYGYAVNTEIINYAHFS